MVDYLFSEIVVSIQIGGCIIEMKSLQDRRGFFSPLCLCGATFMVLSCVSLCGVILSGGFIRKEFVFSGFIELSTSFLACLVFMAGVLFTFRYSVRLVSSLSSSCGVLMRWLQLPLLHVAAAIPGAGLVLGCISGLQCNFRCLVLQWNL